MERRLILVAEDEEIIRLDLVAQLTAMGHAVVAVASAADAIDAHRASQPDLVLMDVELDGPVDGIQAAEQMRKESNVPILFMTGRTEQVTLERAIRSNPAGFIIKPFRKIDLSMMIYVALQSGYAVRRAPVAPVMEAGTVLVLDDVSQSNWSIRPTLEPEGFHVRLTSSIGELRAWADKAQPQCVILRASLLSGAAPLSVVADLRQRLDHAYGPQIPILLLLDEHQRAWRAPARRSGVNECLGEPLRPAELIDVVRRSVLEPPLPAGTIVRFETLEMDTTEHRMWLRGSEVRLTKKEFAILRCLAEQSDQLVSAVSILERAWGSRFSHYTQTLRVHVGNLRQKLRDGGDDLAIEVVHGVGYRLTRATAPEMQGATAPLMSYAAA